MKKLLLSLSIIGAITIGAGAVTYAADNNGEFTNEDININEENYTNEDSYCTYYDEGIGSKDNEAGKGNIDGLQSIYQNRGRCGSYRSSMMK